MNKYIFFNKEYIQETNLSISSNDRGLLYGDGLFETIIFQNNEIKYLDLHWKRFINGAQELFITLPNWFNKDYFKSVVSKLLMKNNIKSSAKIRLVAWRKEGGLYTPKQNQAHIMISLDIFKKTLITAINKVDFSKNIFISKTPFSAFKTLSSINYVMSGIEKKLKQLDDLILLNHNGRITECVSSNIFWITKRNIYTPSIETGCINGIVRQSLISYLKDRNIIVKEVEAFTNELLGATSIFTTNVSRISWIKQIKDYKFTKPFLFEEVDFFARYLL